MNQIFCQDPYATIHSCAVGCKYFSDTLGYYCISEILYILKMNVMYRPRQANELCPIIIKIIDIALAMIWKSLSLFLSLIHEKELKAVSVLSKFHP